MNSRRDDFDKQLKRLSEAEDRIKLMNNDLEHLNEIHVGNDTKQKKKEPIKRQSTNTSSRSKKNESSLQQNQDVENPSISNTSEVNIEDEVAFKNKFDKLQQEMEQIQKERDELDLELKEIQNSESKQENQKELNVDG